jgi:hypothetical protein
MSIIVAVLWNKVNTTFGLLVPLFPWEYDPTGHLILVDLIAVVIYFDPAWLVVDQGREPYTVFSFAKVI